MPETLNRRKLYAALKVNDEIEIFTLERSEADSREYTCREPERDPVTGWRKKDQVELYLLDKEPYPWSETPDSSDLLLDYDLLQGEGRLYDLQPPYRNGWVKCPHDSGYRIRFTGSFDLPD